MVVLKNIRVENDLAYADCYPENSDEYKFDSVVSLTTEEIVSHTCTMSTSHLLFAERLLIRTAKQDKIPEKTFTMWY